MNIKSLLDAWNMPDRTAERTQITLRISVHDYARLHALKAVYPSRSVNDFICDLVKSGLDEIVEALPSYVVEQDDIERGEYSDEWLGSSVGPRVRFDYKLRELLMEKSEEESA